MNIHIYGYVYICMYICMYIPICIDMYLRYIRVNKYIHKYIYICMYIYICIVALQLMQLNLYIYIYICIYIYMYVYVYIYSCYAADSPVRHLLQDRYAQLCGDSLTEHRRTGGSRQSQSNPGQTAWQSRPTKPILQ